MKKIWLLNIISFTAAFLLFQIELIIAKIFLPHYGGSYLVWGSCVVFFQAVLLLGYLFSHFVIQKFGIFKYLRYHLVLLFIPLLSFPGRPLLVEYSQNQIPLAMDVFLKLLLTIGPVFFILSTISIISQSWLMRSKLPQHTNPYALYAVSNLGSFGALLTYPFIFEYLWDISIQLDIWRASYFLLIAFHLLAFIFVKTTPQEMGQGERPSAVDSTDIVRWFLFGAGGVIMFLAVNNIITSEVAPVPILWIIPLCIYLIAWVLNFKASPWCPDWIRENIHILIGWSALLFFLMKKNFFPVMVELALFCVCLFILCMYCQNQLVRHKPRDERNLTLFYAIISLGSFVGGLIITWLIPLITTSLLEYLIGLLIIALAIGVGDETRKVGFHNIRFIAYVLIILGLWARAFTHYNLWGLVLILMLFRIAYNELGKTRHAVALSLACIICLSPSTDFLWTKDTYIYRKRNYYGLHAVHDQKTARFLSHGSTVHGLQSRDPRMKDQPIGYYVRSAPIGQIFTSEQFDFKNIAVMGLGTGTLAAYSKEGQTMDFFELDPDVYTIAKSFFTYLDNARGEINYIYGDARLSFKQLPETKRYDLIVADAFSADSVPVHLLTVDVMSLYREHLADDGVLLFHVSNRYLDLKPVVTSIASSLGGHVCAQFGKEGRYAYKSTWIAVTWNDETYAKLTHHLKWLTPHVELLTDVRPWTDQYSSILTSVRVGPLIDSIKYFQPFYW